MQYQGFKQFVKNLSAYTLLLALASCATSTQKSTLYDEMNRMSAERSSERRNNIHKLCKDVDSLLQLVKEKDRVKLNQKITNTIPPKTNRKGIPALYDIDLHLDGFDTMGISQDQRVIYFARKPSRLVGWSEFGGQVVGWTEFVRDTLKGYCESTKQGILYSDLVPEAEDVDIYEYLDKDYYTNFNFPKKDNSQDILKINLNSNNTRKSIEKIIAAAKHNQQIRILRALSDQQKKTESSPQNTGSKTVYSNMRRDSSGKGIPRRSMTIQERNKGCWYTQDSYISCPTKKQTKRKAAKKPLQQFQDTPSYYSCHQIGTFKSFSGEFLDCIKSYQGTTHPGPGWDCNTSVPLSTGLYRQCPF